MSDRSADDHRFRDWDAAYVLGALSPQDRRDFEEHLRTCDECSAAVTELAGMPALLRMVPAQEALDGADDTTGGEVVQLAALAHSARRVRRNRFVALVAAAAVLLTVGGLAGTFLARPAPEPPSANVTTNLELEPVGDVAVTADLTLQKKGWGTRIDWQCTYPADAWPTGDGPTYELVLVDAAGGRTVVATWLARSTGAHGLGASSSIVTDDIRSVEIRVAGSDEPLARAQT
ncbi:anti-sigma factor [Cellulomonas sp. URHD0024]|uniref:anti-sigma factor family protein n=1 Tax=Cellulomonas sp. URHD0024 TaxID=1302620 RepID=UPI0004281FD3|nr:zf-HC2 domain-containing protein [Cellulomonas sp. URHD0024]